MPTIKDVAKLANVSPAVVSRVINEDATLSIRKETEKRVKDAINTLGYRPNLMARALRVKETKVIAMVIADIANPYFPELVKGAQKAATERGFILTLFDTEEDIENEKKFLKVIADRQMDGVVLTSLYIEDESGKIVDDLGIPFVMIQRQAKTSHGLCVRVDDVKGASLAVQHLIDNGHTKIGTVCGLQYTDPGLHRLQGYKKALQDSNITIIPERIVESDFSEHGGYEAMKKLLALDENITAVFVANDLMAIGALEAIKESDKNAPDDIAVAGFDDIWFSRVTNPALTTVRADLYNMGYIACNLLIQKILDEPIIDEDIVMDVQLVIRESTKNMG
jgi:LacI family transcriptional regulator